MTREFEATISHSIREQVYFYQTQIAHEKENEVEFYRRPKPISLDSFSSNVFRDQTEISTWSPILGTRQSILTADPKRFGFYIPGEPPVMSSPYAYMERLRSDRVDRLQESGGLKTLFDEK